MPRPAGSRNRDYEESRLALARALGPVPLDPSVLLPDLLVDTVHVWRRYGLGRLFASDSYARMRRISARMVAMPAAMIARGRLAWTTGALLSAIVLTCGRT